MYYPTRYSNYNPVYPVYADELYHHGIKGQRWGVRNGPPYPLNAQTHASVVRGGSTRGGRRRIGSSSEMSDAERRARRRKIARNVAIGAGAAAAAGLAGYGIYRAVKRGGARGNLGNADRVKSAFARPEPAAPPKLMSESPVTNRSFHPKSAATVNGRKLTVRERRTFTRAAVKKPRVTRSMHNYKGVSPAQKKKLYRANQRLRRR